MRIATPKFMMNFWGFTGAFGLGGAILPIVLTIALRYFNSPNNQSLVSYQQEKFFTKATLILWPSSIIGLAEAPGNESMIFTYSLTGNVLLYAFVGAFVWLGIKKNKAFFVIPALTLIAIWWRLLSL